MIWGNLLGILPKNFNFTQYNKIEVKKINIFLFISLASSLFDLLFRMETVNRN